MQAHKNAVIKNKIEIFPSIFKTAPGEGGPGEQNPLKIPRQNEGCSRITPLTQRSTLRTLNSSRNHTVRGAIQRFGHQEKKKKKTHSITSRQHRPERFSPKIKSRFFGFLLFFFPLSHARTASGQGAGPGCSTLGGIRAQTKAGLDPTPQRGHPKASSKASARRSQQQGLS